jgi:uncharacterized protein YwqG
MIERSAESWREELLEEDTYSELRNVRADFAAKWGLKEGAVMLIPAAREIDLVMKRVPRGKVVTLDEVKAILAKREPCCSVVCPETSLEALIIAGHAAEEARAEGETMITPYWRTLNSGGEVFADYPGGPEKVAAMLAAEGHTVIKRGSRYFVADYEKKLASLEVDIEMFAAAPELAEVAKKIREIARPSILITADAPVESDLPVGVSKFGGLPDLPAGMEWPIFRPPPGFRRDPEDNVISIPPREHLDPPEFTPIPMMAQIRLSDVAPFDVAGELPASGWLWFFSDAHGMYELYGVDMYKFAAWSSKVLYCPDEHVALQRRQPPGQLPPERPFKARALRFRKDVCVPQYETCWLGENDRRKGPEKLILTSAEMRRYIDLRNDLRGPGAWHRLLGYSDDAQPMLMERGYGDSRSVLFPEQPDWNSMSEAEQYAEMRSGRLLLQIGSEGDINPGRWGRGGFFIREDDLRRRRFDRVWWSAS